MPLLQVTAIPPNTCAHPAADALNVWSVTNKQDYAHLHGHEFHLSAHNIDPTVKARLPVMQSHCLLPCCDVTSTATGL